MNAPDIARLVPVVPAGLPDDQRPMIALVEAQPGRAGELREAVRALTRGCRAEPGCVEFTPYEDALHEGRFHLVEVYESTEAFEAHLTTSHVQEFWQALLVCSTNRDASHLTQLVEVTIGA